MRRLNLRFEERLAERTRVAQELHDTLLQGVISASMQLHIAVDRLSEDLPARASFAHVLHVLGQVVEEGRARCNASARRPAMTRLMSNRHSHKSSKSLPSGRRLIFASRLKAGPDLSIRSSATKSTASGAKPWLMPYATRTPRASKSR